MKKSLKNILKSAVTLVFLYFIASFCAYLAREQLNLFTFIHFILLTFFTISLLIFVMEIVQNK